MSVHRRKQRGAALIIVLLLVATLSFLVLALVSTMSLSIRRTSGTALRGELLWRAVSAEAAAKEAIKTALRATEAGGPPLSLEHPLFSQQFAIPFENGTGAVIFADATRCFNVNSLAANSPRSTVDGEDNTRNQFANDQSAEFAELVAILTALDFSGTDASNITAAIKDFIDPDDIQEIGGAEDGFYASLPSPYRTAGGPIGSVSELRTIKGINPELYAQVNPLLCAIPDTAGMKINVNTLGPDRAVLLSGLTGGVLSARDAEDILSRRPPGGWQNIEEFLQLPRFQDENIDLDTLRVRTAVTSAYIEARAGATVNEIDMNVQILFSIGDASEDIGVVARILGSDS